ncbi:MAG: PilZ domain-containing protein [Chromatiales bacterium]|nr:PilZ domain-containing protein [Chromatiales bacterium]
MGSNSADERRRYFRVDDVVSLNFSVIPADSLTACIERLERGPESSFTLPASLAAISQELRGNMEKIEQLNPTIAAYLRGLDRKIDLLSTVILKQQNEAPHVSRAVNLSAVGMAFRTEQALELDALLELKLLLYPSLTGILTYGKVIKCVHEPGIDPDFPQRVAVEFAYMRDHDRDLLINHVVQCQYRQLQERRRSLDLDNN